MTTENIETKTKTSKRPQMWESRNSKELTRIHVSSFGAKIHLHINHNNGRVRWSQISIVRPFVRIRVDKLGHDGKTNVLMMVLLVVVVVSKGDTRYITMVADESVPTRRSLIFLSFQAPPLSKLPFDLKEQQCVGNQEKMDIFDWQNKKQNKTLMRHVSRRFFVTKKVFRKRHFGWQMRRFSDRCKKRTTGSFP